MVFLCDRSVKICECECEVLSKNFKAANRARKKVVLIYVCENIKKTKIMTISDYLPML